MSLFTGKCLLWAGGVPDPIVALRCVAVDLGLNLVSRRAWIRLFGHAVLFGSDLSQLDSHTRKACSLARCIRELLGSCDGMAECGRSEQVGQGDERDSDRSIVRSAVPEFCTRFTNFELEGKHVEDPLVSS